MKLKEAQIARLAEQVLERLITAGLINLKAERGVVLDRIKKAVASDAKGEEDLEREAERLLEQTLRSMGGGRRHRPAQDAEDDQGAAGQGEGDRHLTLARRHGARNHEHFRRPHIPSGPSDPGPALEGRPGRFP